VNGVRGLGFEVWWAWERREDAVVEGREVNGTSEAEAGL